MSILNPVLKSPFTDVTTAFITSQWGNNPCNDYEMRALDCLEAYGMRKGAKKCDLLLEDFKECSIKVKQILRTNAMRYERHRQHLSGERSSADKYSKNPPKQDAY